MKKNGFTLIELLAVIVILAILALIVSPIISGVITNAKMSAAERSLEGYAQAVELAEVKYQSDNGGNVTKDINELSVEGKSIEKIKNQTVLINDAGIVDTVTATVDGFVCTYKQNTGAKCSTGELVDGFDETSLVDNLKKQYNSTNTVGLLKDDTGYYYKGKNAEVSNNYVWWAGILWRVISIDNSDNITMISSGPLVTIQPASAAWATKDMYDNSYINTWLNSTGEDGVLYKGLTATDKSKIVDSTFNVGIYTNPTELTTTQHFGLLDETQYTKGGGDSSYLDIDDLFGLGNRSDNANVRVVQYNGVNDRSPAGVYGVRAVAKISDITITSGDSTLGTLTNPYKETSTGTNTNNIKVGEYISVPYSGSTKYCNSTDRCLFRVVSTDSNSIKVILNGVLNTIGQFGSDSTYKSGNTIDILIETFVNTIPSTYRYTGTDKNFGIGTYGYISGVGINYNVVKIPTITQNFGLPVIGEMFTSNDIDITTVSKTFVDLNIIENALLTNGYWTMNAFNSLSVCDVVDNGNIAGNSISGARGDGVRPVLFLNKGTNSSLTFTSGIGAPNDPYILGK